MGAGQYISSLLSVAFRGAAYTFLRVIPHSSARFILPALYLAYLLFSSRVHSSAIEIDIKHLHVVAKDTEKKEVAEIDSTTATAHPVYSSPLTGLLLDLPTSSKRIRFASFAINTLLLAAALDFIVHPLINPAHDVIFARVGALTSDSAKLSIRYPQQNAADRELQILYRPMISTATEEWSIGPKVHLTESDDWVSTANLGGLWPSTKYEYRLANVEEADEFLPYPEQPLSFRTFPDNRLGAGSYFRFVVSSCIMPNFPYVPGNDGTIKGFDLLADYLWPQTTPAKTPTVALDEYPDQSFDQPTTESELQPDSGSNVTASDPSNSSRTSVSPEPFSSAPTEFLMFLGDFIYVDVPHYFGDLQETYRRLYRRNYASPSFRRIYEKLPIFHIFDDHEILNNFAGQSNDSKVPVVNALSAFHLYNAAANPEPYDQNEYYYDFRYADVAFFVMDTRRHRSDILSNVKDEHPTMLGEQQITALHSWLGKVNQTTTFKFIISSVPFTSLWGYEGQWDSWAGFAQEKEALLKVMHTVPNVIILSGDRHEFATIEFNSASSTAFPVMEISTSPLSMFYVPFIHTLKLESERQVERTVLHWDEEAATMKEEIEWVPEEKVTKYIPKGNYKWSSIEIDTRDTDKPVVNVEVLIDGEVAHRVHIAGTPVKLHTTTALGAFVQQSFAGVLDKIGLLPSKWF